MDEKQRNVWFSVLLVVVTGFVFFSLGVGVAWKWGFPKGNVLLESPIYPDQGITTTTMSPDLRINLNTATADELMQIAGIGESTAHNIIAYRTKIGKYTFIEQLLDVGGIGETKLKNWSPYLFLDEGDTTTGSSTLVTKIDATSTTTVHSTTATSSTVVASVTSTPSVTTTTVVFTGVLNLNTATAEELMQIDGIGEKTAAAIIAYREEIGGFTYLEQLMDIKGIGEKKFAAWKPYLTLED